jgi:phosphoserine phosphatase
MPSTSKKQHNFMAAIANNPKFAKKAGVPKSVGEEFMKADKGRKFKEGGALKETDAESNPGLAKLPTEVRNKMGYMKKGGMAHSDIKEDMPMMKKVAKAEVKAHEKSMHKMAKGGVTRADGCVTKGHTKGKMVTMKKGGMC